MRILGIDFGTKRVGLAISDGESSIAHKYGIINFKNKHGFIDELRDIIEKEDVGILVIGKPLNLSGRETNMTKQVNDFCNDLKENIDIEIRRMDERFSSESAVINVGSRNKEDINTEAARIILQTYLDKNK